VLIDEGKIATTEVASKRLILVNRRKAA